MRNLLLVLLSCAATQLFAEYPAPYDTVKELLPYDGQGWYTNEYYLGRLINNRKAKVVIELGSWLGKSACDIAKKLPKDGIVYAVDHWFCPPFDQEIPKYYLPFDTNHCYQQFLSNVIHENLTHKIIPIRMSVQAAAEEFVRRGIKADIIYLDATHHEPDVYQDIQTYFPLVKGYGILCGDDWAWIDETGSVQNAVRRFAKENNLKIRARDQFWALYERP